MAKRRTRRNPDFDKHEDNRLIDAIVMTVHLAYYLNEDNDKYGNVDRERYNLTMRWCVAHKLTETEARRVDHFVMDVGPDLTRAKFLYFVNGHDYYAPRAA